MSKKVLFGQNVNEESQMVGIDYSLANAGHAYVVGIPGSGKSNWAKAFVYQIARTFTPDEAKVLIIEVGGLSLSIFDDKEFRLPHLVAPICDESSEVQNYLDILNKEMSHREDILKPARMDSLQNYNKKYPDKTIPYWFLVFDEFGATMGDLALDNRMEQGRTTEKLAIIAKRARKLGIYLILMSQRSSDIDLDVKMLSKYKISFKVKNQIESQTVLDQNGAENLKNFHGILKDYDDNSFEFRTPFESDEIFHKLLLEMKERYSKTDYLSLEGIKEKYNIGKESKNNTTQAFLNILK